MSTCIHIYDIQDCLGGVTSPTEGGAATPPQAAWNSFGSTWSSADLAFQRGGGDCEIFVGGPGSLRVTTKGVPRNGV